MRFLRIIESVFYMHVYRIISLGNIKCRLRKPHLISGNDIVISHKTFIEKGAWIVSHRGSKGIRVGVGCMIHRNVHLDSSVGLSIEQDVLIAEGVYISDNTHNYRDIDTPIKEQLILPVKKTVIGAGTWIGQDAKVIGAEIGKNCVIGANSIVNQDIPDYCVVAGAPARIIKQYNLKTKKWERIF